MTPEESETIDEETAANLKRICGPYERRITELRRQLKWCYRMIWFMQGVVVLSAIAAMLWALSHHYPY